MRTLQARPVQHNLSSALIVLCTLLGHRHVYDLAKLMVYLQTGLRRLVKGEGEFAQVFQKEDQASVHEQIVARVNKYSRQLQERADKELDLLPFST